MNVCLFLTCRPFMNSHPKRQDELKSLYTGTQNKDPPRPPVSSDSYDFGPVHSERGCHDVVLPVFPCVPSLSAPPSEPGELVTPLLRSQTETHADSKEQEEQGQKKKQNKKQKPQRVICVLVPLRSSCYRLCYQTYYKNLTPPC